MIALASFQVADAMEGQGTSTTSAENAILGSERTVIKKEIDGVVVSDTALLNESMDEDTSEEINLPQDVDNSSVLNANNVTLYALNDWAKEYISISNDYAQSFQIKINGVNSDISWASENEEIAYVDKDGIIRPNTKVVHYYYSDGTDEYKREYTFDEAVKLVGTYNDTTLTINVVIKDFSEVYSKNVVKKFLDQNINPTMTTFDKVFAICKFVASYNYSEYYSSMDGLIVSGGGDCWASTETVNYMCDYLGIPNETRVRANKDYGAGSGHRDSYVQIDGKTYIADVGYIGNAPRYFSLVENKDPYTYVEKSDGTLTITDYDGFSKDLEIPAEINGKSVTELGESAFAYHYKIKSIKIPNTVNIIGSKAFESCSSMENVSIPDSITTIQTAAFWFCTSLKEIILPDSVTSIGKNVCCACEAMEKVVLSKNLNIIPDSAFAQTKIHKVVIPEGVTEIDEGAFWNLTCIELPDSINKLKINLYEAKVLYQGTKEQWNNILFDDNLRPLDENIYPSTTGIYFVEKSLALQVGETYELNVVTAEDSIKWQSNDSNIATVSNGKITAISEGIVTIQAQAGNGTAKINIEVKDLSRGINYRTHVQDYGWQNYVQNGVESGTMGQSKRLEAIQIQLNNPKYSGSVQYKTHIQNVGWEKNWATDGNTSGTSGQNLRLEAIQIKLTGDMEKQYDIYYRVHAQNFGWLGWAKNGENAGTAGYSYRLEAIQIQLVKKGGSAPGPIENAFRQPLVSYQTHIQNVGWQDCVNDGAVSGTEGQSLRLEGIKINLESKPYSGGIQYKTHIQNLGWESNWHTNGGISGTSGRSLRLEAIQIELTGEMGNQYDVYYRVHAQNFGNLGWAKNGESAGTAGFGYRLEAIQIQFVKKGGPTPGSTDQAFVIKN